MLVQKNSHLQGNIGMGIAISHFTMMGCIVSIPLNDVQDYDLVAEIDGVLKKIQVKTTRYIVNGKYKVNLGKSKTFNLNQSDLLFVVDANGTKYMIPKEAVNNVKTGIVLGDNYAEFIVE